MSTKLREGKGRGKEREKEKGAEREKRKGGTEEGREGSYISQFPL